MKTFLLLYLLSGQSLDLGTTLAKLHQGCHEANPVNLTTGPHITLLKGGVMVGMTWGFEKSYTPHPTLNTALALTAGSIGFLAGAHNLGVHCR